jgi:hypothetical protein
MSASEQWGNPSLSYSPDWKILYFQVIRVWTFKCIEMRYQRLSLPTKRNPLCVFSKCTLLKFFFTKCCKKIDCLNLIKLTLSITCFLYYSHVNTILFLISLNTSLRQSRVGWFKDSFNLGFALNDKIRPGFFCRSFHNFSKFLRRLFFVIYYNRTLVFFSVFKYLQGGHGVLHKYHTPYRTHPPKIP